jgi:hypothetical protein
MRKVVTTLLGLAVASASGSALAAGGEFSTKGTFAISADRLFGLYITHTDIDYHSPVPTPLVHEELDSTEFGLLWQGATALTPYSVPRASVDYFVIDHLSLGGSLGVATTSASRTVANGPYRADAGDQTGFLFGPRVGFATMFGKVAGIWPRGGLTYYTFSGNGALDSDQLALTAEVMFVLSPAEGVAILVGPTLDFGLTGNSHAGPYGADLHNHAFGIFTAGLMGWL